MGINKAMEEQDRMIREALASAPRSLVRFAPEKGKLDCRLKRMNERKPSKLTEGDVKRAAKILEKAWSKPYITLDEIMASLLESWYYRIPGRGSGK